MGEKEIQEGIYFNNIIRELRIRLVLEKFQNGCYGF